MSTSTSVLPSTAPQSGLPEYSPLALTLWEHNLDRLAQRVNGCGDYKTQRCAKGHTTRKHRFCGTRSCQDCSPQISRSLVEHYKLTAEHLILYHHAKRFTYIDFRFRIDHNCQAIHDTVTSVIEEILRREKLTHLTIINPHELCLFTFAAGFDDAGLLVVRALYMGTTVVIDDLGELLGAVSSSLHIVPKHLIHKFMPQLFAPSIPHDELARADMEIAFRGIRRLRTVGIVAEKEVKELLVEERDSPASTSNSDPDDSMLDTSAEKVHRCPICAAPIVEEGDWRRRNLPGLLPHEENWHPPHPLHH